MSLLGYLSEDLPECLRNVIGNYIGYREQPLYKCEIGFCPAELWSGNGYIYATIPDTDSTVIYDLKNPVYDIKSFHFEPQKAITPNSPEKSVSFSKYKVGLNEDGNVYFEYGEEKSILPHSYTLYVYSYKDTLVLAGENYLSVILKGKIAKCSIIGTSQDISISDWKEIYILLGNSVHVYDTEGNLLRSFRNENIVPKKIATSSTGEVIIVDDQTMYVLKRELVMG